MLPGERSAEPDDPGDALRERPRVGEDAPPGRLGTHGALEHDRHPLQGGARKVQVVACLGRMLRQAATGQTEASPRAVEQ